MRVINDLKVLWIVITNNVKALLIGIAISDIMAEEHHFSIFGIPNLNPYYYKIKKIYALEQLNEGEGK